MWYQFAKVSAEEAATKFLTENDIDYVIMNPAVTIGPLLQPELNGSSSLIFDLINGNFYQLIKWSFCVELKYLQEFFHQICFPSKNIQK